MKMLAPHHRQTERGLMLIEVLTYIAIFAVISTVAFAAFFKYWDAARRLDRATDDMIRALQAGETWRTDIRRTTRPPTLVRDGANETLQLKMSGATVVYRFSPDGVWRQPSPTRPWVNLLPTARKSRMFADDRGGIAAWRWELELALPRKSPGKLIPRFTFLAVPANAHQP
jgi:Tfp pilus assembly protein PilE